MIIEEYLCLGIAPTGHMVVCILILDAERSGHDERLREKGGKVKDKDLTPLLSQTEVLAEQSEVLAEQSEILRKGSSD